MNDRPLRCYVAGVQHESSSFSPIPTGARSFFRSRWGVDGRGATNGLGYGESCQVALDLGFELIAGPVASAQPSLPTAHAVWGELRYGILDELRAAGDVDIVWLCLHGAMMSDQQDDCEGELLAAARSIVGDRVAVGCLLDLHANVTSRMLAAADLVVACREYPHIDYGRRAEEMLPVLARIRRGEARPATAAVRFMAPGAYPTTEEPLASFVQRITALQSEPGLLLVSANHGFEGSDSPELSASVVVTTDGDPDLAPRLAMQVAEDFHDTITSRVWHGPDVAESVEAALAFAGRPVVLADRADNAGGGASSDATFVLAELLRRDAQDVALALLWDPVAVDMCHDAGVGARLPLRIGGKCGPMSGDPLDVVADVLHVRRDATQALFGVGEPMFPLGRTAAIRVGGIDVVLNSIRQQVFSHHVFSQHGIDHLDRHVLVVKSTQHFMNDFGRFAATVIRCDGPGTLTTHLDTLPFRRAPRPLRGLDPVDRVDLHPLPPVPPRPQRFT